MPTPAFGAASAAGFGPAPPVGAAYGAVPAVGAYGVAPAVYGPASVAGVPFVGAAPGPYPPYGPAYGARPSGPPAGTAAYGPPAASAGLGPYGGAPGVPPGGAGAGYGYAPARPVAGPAARPTPPMTILQPEKTGVGAWQPHSPTLPQRKTHTLTVRVCVRRVGGWGYQHATCRRTPTTSTRI
jgi:hypothetical protein